MRLLVLSSRPPWPATRADQLTVDRTIRYLNSRGHTVDLACLVADAAEAEAVRREYDGLFEVHALVLRSWHSYLQTAVGLARGAPLQVGHFRSAAFDRTVRGLVAENDYDLVYAHLIRTSEYARHLPLPRVLGMQISQALNEARIADHSHDPLRRGFHRLESRLCRRYERDVLADFDRVLLVGQRDRDELERDGPAPNVRIRPHGQDMPPSSPGVRRDPDLIALVGMMGSVTNVDAATWMATEILPRVQRSRPNARLAIVGRHPDRKVLALAGRPGVEVTGEVPDVYDWLLKASVAVAPMRMAAGMQNKLVQSLASGAATVATRVANEGIAAEDGRDLLLADDADALAEAVAGLLADPQRAAALGEAGSAFVRERWTWEYHFARLEDTLQELVTSGAGAKRAVAESARP